MVGLDYRIVSRRIETECVYTRRYSLSERRWRRRCERVETIWNRPFITALERFVTWTRVAEPWTKWNLRQWHPFSYLNDQVRCYCIHVTASTDTYCSNINYYQLYTYCEFIRLVGSFNRQERSSYLRSLSKYSPTRWGKRIFTILNEQLLVSTSS